MTGKQDSEGNFLNYFWQQRIDSMLRLINMSHANKMVEILFYTN